jgi:hypothetical protein
MGTSFEAMVRTRLRIGLIGAALAFACSVTQASTTSATTTDGTISGTLISSPVTFNLPSGYTSFSGQGSVFTDSFIIPGSSVLTFSGSGNLDTGPSTCCDNLIIVVQNNTGAAISSFGGFFGNNAIINNGVLFEGTVTGNTFNANTAIYGGDQKNGTGQGIGFNPYTFPTPLAVGASAAFYFQAYLAALTVGTPPGPYSYTFNADLTPVPVPAAAWLMISGLGGLAALARKRRA